MLKISKVIQFLCFFNGRPFISKRNVLFIGTCQLCSYVVTEIAIHQQWRLLQFKTTCSNISSRDLFHQQIFTPKIILSYAILKSVLWDFKQQIYFTHFHRIKKTAEKVNSNVIFHNIHLKK